MVSNWSPTKFHLQSGRYYKYQESEQTIRLLDAALWEALEPGHLDSHNHYFKVNGRWYVYAETPNRYLFEQPAAASISMVNPSDHLDKLFDELKQIAPFQVAEVSQLNKSLKRLYRGVVYRQP